MNPIPSFKSAKRTITPAGPDVFIIDDFEYIEEKNTIKVSYRLREANRKHVEPYRLDVDFQLNALGDMLRAAFNDDSIEEFDATILNKAIGRQFKGEIVHREFNGNKFARIDGFSYKPVNALYTYARTIGDVIRDDDDEPVA